MSGTGPGVQPHDDTIPIPGQLWEPDDRDADARLPGEIMQVISTVAANDPSGTPSVQVYLRDQGGGLWSLTAVEWSLWAKTATLIADAHPGGAPAGFADLISQQPTLFQP